jgi:CRP/FNR family transcriptional regulator, anaerobic regulatory protein
MSVISSGTQSSPPVPLVNLASSCGNCTQSEFCSALFRSAPTDRAVEEPWQRFFCANAGRRILTHGHDTADAFVLCAGWAFRYIQLRNGKRQILRFLLPGDVFSPALIFDKIPECSVEALTTVQACAFKRSEIQARYGNETLRCAITNSFIADGHHGDKLLGVVAHKSAEERIAYLFLHLMRRVASRSVIRDERYHFPLRQQHIADSVGLTAVHVSRVLSSFRERHLLLLAGGVLQVFNREELEKIGSLT